MKNKLIKVLTFLPFLAAFGTAVADEVTIPQQSVSQELHDQLPEKIRQSGKIVAAHGGSFPPYTILHGDERLDGAVGDFSQALSQMLGVEIEHVRVNGLAAELMGIGSGRYDMSLGPIGDYPSRQENADFVDYVQEFVVFAVHTGNPHNINSLDDTCGKRIAVMAAGSAEKVIKDQLEVCIQQGKPEIAVMSYADQPTALLSVRSNRADAFFSSQAPLTYFVSQSDGQLELAATGQANGFGDLFQGMVVGKGSALGPVLRQAFNELIANGTYAKIMQKWGLEGNMIATVEMNLGDDPTK